MNARFWNHAYFLAVVHFPWLGGSEMGGGWKAGCNSQMYSNVQENALFCIY